MADTWGAAIWDAAEWQGAAPPSQDWGTDWRWWYQVGTDPASLVDLNPLIVEARWTGDSHKLGDGTFRGDIQPGQCTIRLWDPAHQLDLLNRYGCVFGLYKPTGACWCYFYDSLARGVFAAGDPADADTVFVGSTWPARLTNKRNETNYPAQSATARLNALVTLLNTVNLEMPAVTGAIATQNQLVAATTASTGPGFVSYPDILSLVRDAASNGFAWWTPTGAATGLGGLTLNYARWDTQNARPLDRSQVIAGPPSTATLDFFISEVIWTATKGDTGATSAAWSGSVQPIVAWQGPSLRVYGDVTPTSGTEYNGCVNTGTALCAARNDTTEQVLSTLDVQSGFRRHPDGSAASADWDPYAHHFAPIDVVSFVDNAHKTKQYAVIQSSHRLTARVWQTTHTLEKYAVATPLP